MGAPLRRAQFVAGHWLARAFAARVLRVDLDGFTLVRADDGSPRLHVDGRFADWHVSLTHSADWVACALAPDAVGVDLEMPKPGRDFAGLAAFAFSPQEGRRLAAMPDEARGDEFHRLWSLKEARGNRLGEGLLPRRSRRITAWRCEAASAEAATWPLENGTLSLVCAGVAGAEVEWLTQGSAPEWWRFEDAPAGDA